MISQRVVIVGAGNVGASIAYSILNQEFATEILIIDIAEEFAKAQVADMTDSAMFTSGVSIKYASYADIIDGDIVVITCGANQKEGQSRMELLDINTKIIKSVVESINQTSKNVFIVMVTNPLDIMTYVAVKTSNLPSSQVFGSGTLLDSARLKKFVQSELQANPTDISAMVIGEHGDTSLPLLSQTHCNSQPLSELVEIDSAYYAKTTKSVREEALNIIAGKKATYYGIGSAVAVITKSIIQNENRMMPLCTLVDDAYGIKGICIGLPVTVGSGGVSAPIELKINDIEKDLLQKSADYLASVIKQANL